MVIVQGKPRYECTVLCGSRTQTHSCSLNLTLPPETIAQWPSDTLCLDTGEDSHNPLEEPNQFSKRRACLKSLNLGQSGCWSRKTKRVAAWLCAPERAKREWGSRGQDLSQGLAIALGYFSPSRYVRVGSSSIENQLVLWKLLKDFVGSSIVDRTMVYLGELADNTWVYRGHGQTCFQNLQAQQLSDISF